MKPSNGQVYNSLVFGRPKILLIAPHKNIAEPFRAALEKHGFAVTVTDSSSSPSRSPHTEHFALVVTLWQNGLHQTDEADIFSRTVDALFMLGYQTPTGTVVAFQNGVYRFGTHDTDADKLVKTVRELLEAHHNAQHELARGQAKTQNHHKRSTLTDLAFNELDAQSPKIEEVRQQIKRISQCPGMPVLITGETGAGKEVVANLLHYSSSRADKPMIRVNCSAIPETLFESQLFGHRKGAFTGAAADHPGYVRQAQGGTLFLDELSTLTLAQQAKLLRFLQDGGYMPVGATVACQSDVWVIAATNQVLVEQVRKGEFREDLYHRLKALQIHLPTLRERPEDIMLLAHRFLEKAALKHQVPVKLLAEETKAVLLVYHWPGNVRELEQLMEALMIMVEENTILPEHLPPEFRNTENARLFECESFVALCDLERTHIVRILEQTGFNLKRTALRLGISRNALKRNMKKYKIPVVRNGPP